VTDSDFAAPPPADPSELVPAPGFSSRREMRQAGGYLSTEAEPRAVVKQRPKKGSKRTRVRDAVRSGIAKPTTSGWRRKLSSAGVMTVVVGLLASVTLPAFADQNPLALTTGPIESQTFEVTAATADESLFIRDGYGTTSAADLRRLYADAIRQQNLAAYLASGARALGDDYPWPEMLSRPQGGGLSPLNYYYRECVDFVAWRLNRDVGSTGAPFTYVWSNLAQGSAYSWKRAWESKGWTTSATPVAGAVAWFPGGNHVAYVSGILPDGSVALEEYNYSVDHGYSQRVIQPGEAFYLYPPG
jgi:surface antigen